MNDDLDRIRRHAVLRASQRYGIDLHPDDLALIGRAIERRGWGVAYLPGRSRDGTRRRVAVWFRFRWLLAVYDFEVRTVVTFLPPGRMAEHHDLIKQSTRLMKGPQKRLARDVLVGIISP